EARIVQGGIAVRADDLRADLAWQEELYGQGIATYVDVLAVHPPPGAAMAEIVSSAYDLLLSSDPSAQLWVNEVDLTGRGGAARAADLLARFVVGHGEGAALVTFNLRADIEGRPEFFGVLLDIHKLFAPSYGVVFGGSVDFEPPGTTGPSPPEVTSYTFFDAKSFQGLVAFQAPVAPPGLPARMVIDTAAVRGAVTYDIIGGRADRVGEIEPDFRSNTTRIPVTLRGRPQIVRYARVPIKGFEAEKEEVEIRGTGLITAEEVIAGHQAFMADQDHRLRHYRADAMLTYRAKIGGSDTIEIGIDNSFFLDRATGAEWEQRAFYYNGVLWKGKKVPKLPFPDAEKVFELPLEINLNKDYDYDYRGRQKVGKFDCYVIDFEPLTRDKALFKGRAWIETRTFAPVKTATVRTRLTPPMISDEEIDFYAPIAGPDGSTYWLRERVEGQQILTLAGENVVLLREIEFGGFRINDPDFAQARERAYGSEHQMLRDTDRGLRYLERTDSGERVVQEETLKTVLLGLAGLFRQPGIEFPVVPLAGISYVDFRFRDTDAQLTALLGGVINLVSLSDPKFIGERVDGSVQLVTLAVDVTDRLFVEGEEREESDIDARTQGLSAGVGFALGDFFRLKGLYGLQFVNYSRDEDTDTFVTPSDTFIHSPGVEVEFNRSAWTVTASARRSFRTSWEPWGDTSAPSPEIQAEFPTSACDAPGSCLDEFDPDDDTYDRFEFSVSKQLFLPLFQKLRFEAIWQTGSRLDRFSEFQFSFFGNRVRGFSGSGVRYDRGAIARAQYAFNIADIVRFEASLDHAYVKDSLTSDGFMNFTGFGVSGNLMGPWETILQFDIGVALRSDFDELRGDTEFQIGLLKYF
ncbi:MAG: hypothetical protein ACE5JH_06050, partial [Acidobacteriota bacterium]